MSIPQFQPSNPYSRQYNYNFSDPATPMLAEHRETPREASPCLPTSPLTQELLGSIKNNLIPKAQSLLEKGAKPDDACYEEALQKRNFVLAKEMLKTGVLPAHLALKLIDPSKRDFAKAWLEQITDPVLRFMQALRFKDFDFIKMTYDFLIKNTTANFLNQQDTNDKSSILNKLMLKYPELCSSQSIFLEAWKTACSEKVSFVKFLVTLGYCASTVDKEHNNGLHIAVAAQKAEIVEFLTQFKELNPNQKNVHGMTPLQDLLQKHRLNSTMITDKMILDLLQAGSKIESMEDAKWIWQHFSDHAKARNILIESCPNLVCWVICQNRSANELREFLKKNSNFSFSSEQIIKIWMAACANKEANIIKTLIDSGLIKNLHQEDNEGCNGLHIAARNFSKGVLEYLICVLDVNKVNKKGFTPLQELCASTAVASSDLKIEIALCFLQAGAKIGWQESTIIFNWCCERDDVINLNKMIQMLVIQEEKGSSSFLHLAAGSQASQVLAYLLKIREWNVNLRNENAETPLFMLCNSNFYQDKERILGMMQNLFKAHANPNIPNLQGKIPLTSLFQKIWQNHLNQMSINSSPHLNIAGSSFEKSEQELSCIQFWASHSHDLCKHLIDLFYQYGADFTSLIEHMESTYWQETVHQAPSTSMPFTVETKSHSSSSNLVYVHQMTYYPGTPSFNIVTRQHSLKKIANVTYSYLKEKQK